jgi:hypothetical protein
MRYRLSLLVIFSCLTIGCGVFKKDMITVSGFALDAKAGAIIMVNEEMPYYIDGLDHWDEKYYGKKLIVTGYLKKVKYKQRSTPDKKVQEMKGTQLVMMEPEWRLAE